MAAGQVPSVESARTSQNCTEALAAAVLEWFLLFVLFVNAFFSYAITKFASYCGLRTPCLLCSRLDHVLGNKKVGFYWDIICAHHKLEISSLVLCRAHDKLVDVHHMCESCLFSFATINKSNAETYRLLVGKLGEDTYSDSDEKIVPDDQKLSKSGTKLCFCCSEPWTSKCYSKKLMLTRSIGSDFMDPDASLLCIVSNDRDTQEISGKGESQSDPHRISKESNQLSHVGYTKLKINSDTESDVLFSDDDAGDLLLKAENPEEEEVVIHSIPPNPPVKISDPSSVDESSASNPPLDTVEVQVDTSTSSFVEQGLDKIKCIECDIKETNVALSSVPELISFDDIDSATNDVITPHGVVEEGDSRGSSKADNFTSTDAHELFNMESSPITANEKSVEANPHFSDNLSQVPNLLDLGDAYKLAVGNRGKQLSGLLVEQWLSKDSSKVSQELRNLFSQLSAARGLEQSLSDLSPKLSVKSDEQRAADGSNSGTFQFLQKRISLERNESGLSLDGSIVSEIDGESVLDRWKRQIEHDRKALSALYKELEEERNASAVSANQAMAMITRLQEEKATLQMEALQYLRMMEEQAEYDMEALQKTNDLLSEREKEIQDLEAELGFLRNKYPDESPSEDVMEPIQMLNDHEVTEIRDEATANADVSDTPAEVRIGILKNAAVEIEEEKMHILSCLEKLEKKLALSSKCPDDQELDNGELSKGDVQHEPEEPVCERDLSGDCEVNSSGSAQQIGSRCEADLCSIGHVISVDNTPSNQRHNDDGHTGKSSPYLPQEGDFTSLKSEYSYLLRRMEDLESDHHFLEHTINCLRIGEEGLQFIQDIALHLRELRTVGMKDN